METMSDVKKELSELYKNLKQGSVELKTAGELANIAGKFLKAEQLQLAREMFEKLNPPAVKQIEQPQ